MQQNILQKNISSDLLLYTSTTILLYSLIEKKCCLFAFLANVQYIHHHIHLVIFNVIVFKPFKKNINDTFCIFLSYYFLQHFGFSNFSLLPKIFCVLQYMHMNFYWKNIVKTGNCTCCEVVQIFDESFLMMRLEK